jgi:hypothetical protein
VAQAIKAGEQLQKLFGSEPIRVYVSPFQRTRQTAELLLRGFPKSQYVLREDPSVREQERANFQDLSVARQQEHDRDAVGAFFYRFPTGESGMPSSVLLPPSVFHSSLCLLDVRHKALTCTTGKSHVCVWCIHRFCG